jgi:N6-L-threonylcarbamoyladenine synthase
MPFVVGIDTSAYTCSVAVMDLQGTLHRDVRLSLRVPEQQVGLRQGEALYQHVRRMPEALEVAFAAHDAIYPQALRAVAVSTAPRAQEDSFMPVFLAGHGAGRAVAAARGIPCFEASHQEGHLWAALWALPAMSSADVVALHLSGGTTEAVSVQGVGREHETRPALDILAATSDITAGKFIDRVGQALGLPFPAGPHLEQLAQHRQTDNVRLPVSVDGLKLSFSGPETAAQRAIAAGALPADVAGGVFDCLGESLRRWLQAILDTTRATDVVLAGGVVANQLLRQSLEADPSFAACRLWFTPAHLSSDNAVGLAAWAAARIKGVPIRALAR